MFEISKRIVLFVVVNVLILVTISLVLNILGIQPYLDANGINYSSLMMFCLVWGMMGSFISLLLSRFMAKMMMGVKVIDPNNNGSYQWLAATVAHIAKSAGLEQVPEVGVYESSDVNAFATGPAKSMSLVAFSTGLLQSMSREEVEGVAAHEISHIKNGDMVTMTLIQGVINAFVMFFARIIAFAVSQSVKEESQVLVRHLITILLEICLSILGMMVVGWFSRQREFRADKGSAGLVGTDKMIAALKSIGANQRRHLLSSEPASLATLKISGRATGLLGLMATHPPLEDRIEALELYR